MVEARSYVTRPEWRSNADMSIIQKKDLNFVERNKLKFADKKLLERQQCAVQLSIEGRRMKLSAYNTI